ncbi:MAG: condensation domain-containing protein [Cyanobacteria bacterium P01_F01_bin.53]
MKPVMQMNNQTTPSAESPLTSEVSSRLGAASVAWAAQSNLTAAQRQLWLGQKLSPDAPLYNMAFLFTFSGELDPTHFQAAFQALVQRCDALRTVIEEVDGVPQQRVQEQMGYSVPVLDFRGDMSPEDAVRASPQARTASSGFISPLKSSTGTA